VTFRPEILLPIFMRHFYPHFEGAVGLGDVYNARNGFGGQPHFCPMSRGGNRA